MKSFLITFFVIAASFTSLEGQWEVINEGHEFRIIDFVSKDIGWMATEDTILKTTDGGETWISDPWNLGGGELLGYEYIEDFDFVNDSVGWIVMNFQTMYEPYYGLYLTVNGGQSWEKSLEGKGLELEFVSEDMVIVSTEGDDHYHLLKSKDGGITWEDISPGGYFGQRSFSISFASSDTGLFTTWRDKFYEVYRTFNGGRTWHHGSFSEFGDIRDIGFINKSDGYFVAQNRDNSNHVICKTEDAFDTWTVVIENQYPIHSCHFFNKDICVAIFEDSIGCNIVKSYDGGESWIDTASFRLPARITKDIQYDILFSTDSIGFIYSQGWICDLIFKSIDQGDTWSNLNISYPFSDVCFVTDQKGFVVGGSHLPDENYGDIFGTIDGGKSWYYIFSYRSDILSCNFVNDSIGFVDLYPGISTQLYQTSDGGESWFAFPNEFNQFTSFRFINEHVGFAGNDSGVYITYSGGETWDRILASEVSSLITDPFWHFISSIVAGSENTFWAIAGDGRIIKFTNEGAWEKTELETDLPLYKILFTDENTGWIAGGYQKRWNPFEKILFKTEDGGESWFEIDNPYQLVDIYFKDKQYGWAVGRDSLHKGVILETTNGGEDWIVQVDSLSAPLNAFDYRDGFMWAVGENGLILKMYDSTYISAIERPNRVIDGNSLLYLYPNPTNSILNIETETSGQYFIELYNLNGQLLFNDKMNGTTHQVDLSSFQKGVYFITIRSNDFVTTRKIIKL